VSCYRICFVPAMLAAVALMSSSSAEARGFTTRALQGPELVPPGPVIEDPWVYPVVDACCPPKIRTRHHRLGPKPCGGWGKTVDMLLEVKSRKGCCLIEVPVRVPLCCVDVPKVNSRSGLLGRTIHHYHWKCGYRIKLVVNRHGDVVVHYYRV
jgi:hypothetical protein